MQLKDLGFDHEFFLQGEQSIEDGGALARVSAVDRGSYRLLNEQQEVPAELSGKLLYRIESPADLPCVGDWVEAQYYNDNHEAIIHRVLPRRTFLCRRGSGDGVHLQMIGANIDTAFLVQSCHFDFNPNRLERYLVMVADGGVEPVIVLTKTDLISAEELEQKLAVVRSITRAGVVALSNLTGSGFEQLEKLFEPGKTSCLLGSSGVGKTTILNRLLGREAFTTQAVSGTGEGTHTTTRRQLIVLASGAMLIDTPGMRELGVAGAGDGIGSGLDEVSKFAAACRYADCTHQHEPGCAVRAALERGELREERLANYVKLKKEAEFYEMSSLDKRKKDKAFGKLVKSVKKQMKK